MRLHERSRIVLMAAAGMTNVAIRPELGDAYRHGESAAALRGRGEGIEKERPRSGNYEGQCPKTPAPLRTEIIRRPMRKKAAGRDALGRTCRWRRVGAKDNQDVPRRDGSPLLRPK